MIDSRRRELAEAITNTHYERFPELEARYGPIGRVRCLEDAEFHLSFLSEAMANQLPHLFADYIGWAKAMLQGRGIPPEDLAVNLDCMRQALRQSLPEPVGGVADRYIAAGLEELPRLPGEPATFLLDDAPHTALAREFLQALLDGQRQRASRMILDAVADGITVRDIYLHVFQPSQREIGRLWQINRLTVAQEHYCTAATQLIMSQLYANIFSSEKNGRTMVATCVSGDLHEIGVRMVSDFFEMEGWSTFYVGANAPTSSIVSLLVEQKAELLAVSATMTFHVHVVEELIAAVRKDPRLAHVKVIVGGYPFNLAPDLWRSIGADACANDALDAVAIARRLVGLPEGR